MFVSITGPVKLCSVSRIGYNAVSFTRLHGPRACILSSVHATLRSTNLRKARWFGWFLQGTRSARRGEYPLRVYDVPCKSESLRKRPRASSSISLLPPSAPYFFYWPSLREARDTGKTERRPACPALDEQGDAVPVPNLLVRFAGMTIQSRVYATQRARRAFVEGCFFGGVGSG
ncbi:hypothetical protein X777_13730 [Ooceraea biroi]|uniref:Uncharacterized protein n=1 Tax=Ooceraea biroi TaxID=2015173 RepID=A0A026VXD1_OOCBI|nr:hypothetical protein X777_13730 [Ooceraea biroi]